MRAEELFEALEERFDHNAYYRTFRGRIKKMYGKARERTASKGHKGLLISQEEFFKFAEKDRKYKEVFKKWEESGFDIRMTPTLDRIDANKGYVVDNLQILSYGDNVVKGNKEYDKRPYEARMKKLTLEKDGKKKEFSSLTQAALFLETSPSTMTRALQAKKPVGGWTINVD